MSLIRLQSKCAGGTGGGFSLIEVLISLVILAVGLLGMTGMQNEALKYNHAAFIDSQAQFLLNDMMERIRANPGSGTYGIGFTEDAPTPPVDCTTNTCTPAQMTAWDLDQWRELIEDPAYLPQGESEIVYDSITQVFTISIRYEWSQLGGVDISGGMRTVSVTTRI